MAAQQNIKKYTPKTTTVADIEEEWFLIDAKGARLGRLATKAAELLLAKHNPKMRNYLTPQTKVVVVNAEKIDLTEKKKISKVYSRYSGYPDGLKQETLGTLMDRRPKKAVEAAIKGMLPKNRRGKAIYAKNLYVYAGADHKHEAQKPQAVEILTEKKVKKSSKTTK